MSVLSLSLIFTVVLPLITAENVTLFAAVVTVHPLCTALGVPNSILSTVMLDVMPVTVFVTVTVPPVPVTVPMLAVIGIVPYLTHDVQALSPIFIRTLTSLGLL